MRTLVPDDTSVGRSAPLHPLGDEGREGCDPLALSRGCSGEALVPDDAGCPFGNAVSDSTCVGHSASLLPTGCERVAPLSRSPGAVLVEILVSDEAGYSLVDVVSDDTGVGRSAPLHPLGGRGARGCDPLALSRGCSGGEFCSRRSGIYFLTIMVSDRAGVGRSAPLHPLG